MRGTKTITDFKCYHCGESCIDDLVRFDEKIFCCQGCQLVYNILNESNLCTYYSLQQNPGNTQKAETLGERFSYLDEPGIQQKLIKYKDDESVHLRFHIPKMHCSSCIWLLEHLTRLDQGIVKSQVDFIQKEILIVFHPEKTTLRKVVELLITIGYEPELNFELIQKQLKKKESRIIIFRIGIAGFAFGNIMLLSFPEYFSSGQYEQQEFRQFFGYLNLFLALPVFIFSGGEFLLNAWRSFKQRSINIDVPIAIGITAMFLRSTYEIISGTGAGYFDSMTGLIFFMLIGRNFQNKTFQWLSFERDFKSYFPIAVTRMQGTKEESVVVSDLKINDRLRIRNQEIIPTDVLLIDENAEIDYSFVTGESFPVSCNQGDHIFAGGRLLGNPTEVLVQQEVSHSYLTQLWNKVESGKNNKTGFENLVSVISKWFILVTLAIAAGAYLYWYPSDPARAINALTAVLVIACPCALALSAPFTFGNMIRILGKNGIYLKNASVIAKLSDINKVVFDKTGTLTEPDVTQIEYQGVELSQDELSAIQKIASSSSHPLSLMLSRNLNHHQQPWKIEGFTELTGAGVSGKVQGMEILIGKAAYCGFEKGCKENDFSSSRIYIRINQEPKGVFLLKNVYRKDAAQVLEGLRRQNLGIAVISGDHEGERPHLEKLLHQKNDLFFNQTPLNKLEYVNTEQQAGKKILMVGDGLNDAGALIQSDAGLTLTNDLNNFSPACDGIILGDRFNKIPALLKFSKSGIRIIIISFVISIVYNAVGLSFAITGTLSPVIAAILMPISTTSLVLYTVISSSLKARQLQLTAKT
ncbi:heavy metal translocating P-type ATPase metal-binding domain-containing protein [soil metagenome]